MIRLLGPAARAELARIAGAPALLAFDFDGTLAPIVASRQEAAMRPATAGLLRELCAFYPVAVISGRSRDDVAGRLAGAGVKYVVGNHGLEPGVDLDAFEQQMRRALPLLEAALAPIPGLDLEDKRYSLAVHYRRSRRRREALAAIEAATEALPVVTRLVRGKHVVNVVPARAANKGDALLGLSAREGARAALYVGDDLTDEDVFRLDPSSRVVGVRVGASSASAAGYYLRSQREIDVLLARLVALRATGGADG